MKKLILISLLASFFLASCSAKIYDTSHKLYDKYNKLKHKK